jgi:hypothetical protein
MDGPTVVARFAAEGDWLEATLASVERARETRHPALAQIEDAFLENGALVVTYRVRSGASPLGATSTPARVVRTVADIADGVGALTSSREEPLRLGPFSPKLFWHDELGGQLIASPLWRSASEWDRTVRGRTMAVLHFIISPEDLARGAWGPQTETFFLAYALFELLTGREPFPHGSEFEYMNVVRNGASTRLRALRADVSIELEQIVSAALAPELHARPHPVDLARALRAAARQL